MGCVVQSSMVWERPVSSVERGGGGEGKGGMVFELQGDYAIG